MSRQDSNTTPNQTTDIAFRVVIGPQISRWDAQADAFAMTSYQQGLTVPQITTQLCRNGYAASQAEVIESLGRQVVQTMPPAAEPGLTTLRWNDRADAFTLAAHRVGQTPAHILARLSAAGYEATIEEVAASLERQGVRRA